MNLCQNYFILSKSYNDHCTEKLWREKFNKQKLK